MPLRDILKKKEKLNNEDTSIEPVTLPKASEFTFLRSTTNTQEPLELPPDPIEESKSTSLKSKLHFRKSSKSSRPSTPGSGDETASPPRSEKRLSDRLHLSSRSRSASASSSNIPADLPKIPVNASGEDTEAEWEKRATILAQANPNSRPTSATPDRGSRSVRTTQNHTDTEQDASRKSNDEDTDVNIQAAIRLHEAGELHRSTAMFGKLADPDGANDALSQVLYGLALRHGWGIAENPALSLKYLSYAASNSAAIESLALAAGMKKGGAAKGELVLAMFELANSFRNGWGVAKDPVAARHYYETAANLGDTDAMNEAAWCWLEGFGGPKDKYKAAMYLRRAEENGHKTLGNTWIWKPKYDPVK